MKKNPFKILSIAILAAVVFYFGVQGWRYIKDPYATTLAYTSRSTQSITLGGWIIRSEETFSSDTEALRRLLDEGEHVGQGQAIAVSYNSKDALRTVEEIEQEELQLQQLEFALSTYLDADAALKLDSSITDSILHLHTTLSGGDYSAASDELSELKAAILKRNHTYSSDDSIQADIDSVKAHLKELRSSLSGAKNIKAPLSGTYSAACDGYETVLTPDILSQLTPSILGNLQPAETNGNVGKLIYGSTWYYAANIPAEQAEKLQKGQRAALRFAKGLDQDIPAEIYRISDEQSGQRTVILSCNQYLAATTLLRHQQAELILDRYSGLRIPSAALYINEAGQTGVYGVVGMTARFKPVDVVYLGDGYTLVKPTGESRGSTILRSGDEVIITAEALEDGKVITP